MDKYDEDCALNSVLGVGCYVRTYKDGSKLEIEFTNQSNEWLTDPRLAKENGEAIKVGELNKKYLHKKLDDFIEAKLKEKNHVK